MHSNNPTAYVMDFIDDPFDVTGENTDAGFIRKEHIRTETSVKAIGWFSMLAAGVSVLWSLQFMSMSPERALVSLGLAVALFISGLGLSRLQARGRLLYTVVSVVSFGAVAYALLSGFARSRATFAGHEELLYAAVGWPLALGLGLLVLFLSILWSRKGGMVLSEQYRGHIIPRAPHVKYRSHAWLLFAIWLMVVFAAAARNTFLLA